MLNIRAVKVLLTALFVSALFGLNVNLSHASLGTTPTTWGAFFNNTPTDGSYLTYTNSSYFNIGASQDFTVAWWQYDTATPGGSYWPRVFQLGTSGNGALSVSEENGTFYLWNPGTTMSFSMTQIQNAWVHYAIVRSSGTITLYENGISKGTPISMTLAIGATSDPLLLGSGHNHSSDQTAVAFGGYLTGFEWIIGTAKYTSAFTPVSTRTGYTSSVTSGTKLLLFPTSALTSTTDYSGNNITPNSNMGNVAYGYQLTQLSTPSAPTVSGVSGYSLAISDTAVANASSYVANVFTTSGSTFVESQTISSGNIGSPTILGNLNPNTSYSLSITAVGDGITYSTSAASTSSVITTGIGSTTATLLDANNGNAIYRTIDTVTLTTSGSSSGKASFFQSGKAIPGCKSIAVSGSIARCYFKPAQVGINRITATFTPGTSSYSTSSSQTLPIVVARRTNLR